MPAARAARFWSWVVVVNITYRLPAGSTTGLDTSVPPVTSVGTLASMAGSVTNGPQGWANRSVPPLSERKAMGWALVNSW